MQSHVDQKENSSEPDGPSDGLGERDRDERQIIAENDEDRDLVPQKLIKVVERSATRIKKISMREQKMIGKISSLTR